MAGSAAGDLGDEPESARDGSRGLIMFTMISQGKGLSVESFLESPHVPRVLLERRV